MPYKCMSDDALCDLITRRDRAALSALYDRYAAQAHAVALLVTREPATAAAVVEEVFWQFWQRSPAIESGSSVRNSLMLSARAMAGRMRRPSTL